MRLTANRDALLRDLSFLSSAVESKGSAAWAGALLLSVSDGEPTARVFDGTVSARTSLDVASALDGACIVNLRDTIARLRAMPDGADVSVSQETAKPHVTISSGRLKHTVLARAADDFPAWPACQATMSIDGATFAAAINRVRWAVNRYGGKWPAVFVRVRGSTMRVDAGNGAALATFETETDIGVNVAACLPAAFADLLCGSAPDGELGLSLGSHVLAEFGRRAIHFPTLPDEFTMYDNAAIDTRPTSSAIVRRVALADAVRATAPATTGRARGVRFTIDPDGIDLFASSPELGEATDRIDARGSVGGKPARFGMGVPYVLAALESIDSQDVALSFGGELDPIWIEPATPRDGLIERHIIMPMRLD